MELLNESYLESREIESDMINFNNIRVYGWK